MRSGRIATMAFAIVVGWHTMASSAAGGGVGVLGDSYSDEYRFYPPDRSTVRNWVEILAEARGIDFGPYTEMSRGEPRNQGFAYNWARSDAKTSDMLATGQHTGVAEQVLRGEVDHVVMMAGGNDFIHALRSDDPDGMLQATREQVWRNYRAMVRTILDASPRVNMLLVTLPDILELPEFEVELREGRLTPERAAAYRAGVRGHNEQVRALAATHPRVAVLDMERVAQLTVRLGKERVLVVGKILDRLDPANHPDHLFLADQRHLGGFGQAFLAKLIVDALNRSFQAGIEPIHVAEVYSMAEAREPARVAENRGHRVIWSRIGLKGKTRQKR